MTPIGQHQVEIARNLSAWQKKPLLQEIYASFYRRIIAEIDPALPGIVVEAGSGIGNLKRHLPSALCTDLFPNPWLDVVCDAYELPFGNGSVSHLVLFDVFHHLEAPRALFREARRVLCAGGRLILFEPFISLASRPIYGLLHHEPIGWEREIDAREELPRPREYYASQGNATRLFFGDMTAHWMEDWELRRAEAFSSFGYLLSGGYSQPAVYPRRLLHLLSRVDRWLSRWPWIFGARCLVVLQRR